MIMIDIRLGDCMELIKTIPDKSVDFVLTDPPYEFKDGGFGGGSKPLSQRAFKKELMGNPLFHKDFDADILMTEIERVCKKVNCVVFCTDVMLLKLLNYAEKKKYYYTITFWHKTNPPPFVNNNYLKDVEIAVAIREKGCAMYGDYYSLSKVYTDVVNKEDKDLYNHPTIKPVNLIEKYILNHTKENDTVLDFYMGSGTTGVACKNLKRNFIGFELNPKYFETAKKRIDNTHYQPSLF